MAEVFALKSRDGVIHIGQCTGFEEKRNMIGNDPLPSNSRMRIIESEHGTIYLAAYGSFVRVQILLAFVKNFLKDKKLSRTLLERDLVPAWESAQENSLSERIDKFNSFGFVILVQNGRIFSITPKGGISETSTICTSDSDVYTMVQSIYDKYDGYVTKDGVKEIFNMLFRFGLSYEPVFYMNDKDGEIEIVSLGGDK